LHRGQHQASSGNQHQHYDNPVNFDILVYIDHDNDDLILDHDQRKFKHLDVDQLHVVFDHGLDIDLIIYFDLGQLDIFIDDSIYVHLFLDIGDDDEQQYDPIY
jgi:hypothetical protein